MGGAKVEVNILFGPIKCLRIAAFFFEKKMYFKTDRIKLIKAY